MQHCKFCNARMPKGIKICPKCRQPQGNNTKPVIIGGIVVIALLIAVFFIFKKDKNDIPEYANNSTGTSQENETANEETNETSNEPAPINLTTREFGGIDLVYPEDWTYEEGEETITLSPAPSIQCAIIAQHIEGVPSAGLELNLSLGSAVVSALDSSSSFKETDITLSGQPAREYTCVWNIEDLDVYIKGYTIPVKDSLISIYFSGTDENYEKYMDAFEDIISHIDLPEHEF